GPKGDLVAVDNQGTLRRWALDSATGRAEPARTISLPTLASVQSLKFNSDLTTDGRFALGWHGAKLHLFDLERETLLGSYDGGPDILSFANAAYSPETQLLVASYTSAANQNGLLAWRTSAPEEPARIPTRVGNGYPNALTLGPATPGGQSLAVG